jgi:uncharacterized protein (TIGR03067 family)
VEVVMARLLALTISLCVLVCVGQPGIAVDSKNNPADKDRELLQGEWVYIAYIMNGMRAPDDVLKKAVVSFRDGKFASEPMLVASTNPKTGETTWKAEGCVEVGFELGTSGKFQTIDLVVVTGKEASRLKGIYALDGDELRICFSLGAKPPTDFESKAGSDNRLFVLKRLKR